MQNHYDPSAVPPPESGWSGKKVAVAVVMALVLGAVLTVGALFTIAAVVLSQTADASSRPRQATSSTASTPDRRSTASDSAGSSPSSLPPVVTGGSSASPSPTAADDGSEKVVTGSVVVHDGAFKSAGCKGGASGRALRDGGLVELLDEHGRQLGTARMRRDTRDVETDWCIYKFSMPKVPSDRSTYRFRIAGLGETPLPHSEMKAMGWFVWLDVGRVPSGAGQ